MTEFLIVLLGWTCFLMFSIPIMETSNISRYIIQMTRSRRVSKLKNTLKEVIWKRMALTRTCPTWSPSRMLRLKMIQRPYQTPPKGIGQK
ncbi:hypothetical protein F5X96DRAFT_226998 [Biscogniauxia mediterranea]|nr:hypothetical protein F5X96DRAFT_226998 [Biscogniauxia mediterranea]